MSAHRILQSVSKFTPYMMNRVTAGVTNVASRQPSAFISTSKKKSDTTIVADPTSVTAPKTVEDFANPNKKNYQDFGFAEDDPDLDINRRNQMMFISVTICLVGGGFYMMYFPDQRLRDWTKRQAYIELARREALGLPAVDPNLVPPENVHLPTEEELGDFELII